MAKVEELQRLDGLRRFLSPQIAELIGSADGDKALASHRREIKSSACCFALAKFITSSRMNANAAMIPRRRLCDSSNFIR